MDNEVVVGKVSAEFSSSSLMDERFEMLPSRIKSDAFVVVVVEGVVTVMIEEAVGKVSLFFSANRVVGLVPLPSEATSNALAVDVVEVKGGCGEKTENAGDHVNGGGGEASITSGGTVGTGCPKSCPGGGPGSMMVIPSSKFLHSNPIKQVVKTMVTNLVNSI